MQGSEKQSEVRIKKFMTMMDSMTEQELNTNDIKILQQPSRVTRISRGAGRRPEDYYELLGGPPAQFRQASHVHSLHTFGLGNSTTVFWEHVHAMTL